MDVEKTIHAILESQLRAEQRANRADQRADRADKRMDRFDKQLQSTAALVKKGIQVVLDSRKETNFKVNALIASQMRLEEVMRKNDEKFNRLLESLSRKSSNGHK